MLKILKRLNAKEWAQVGISLIFIVLQVWLDLKLPDYMSADHGQLTQDPGAAPYGRDLDGGRQDAAMRLREP